MVKKLKKYFKLDNILYFLTISIGFVVLYIANTNAGLTARFTFQLINRMGWIIYPTVIFLLLFGIYEYIIERKG